MLSVIRYSLYGELQPIPSPNFEPGTWKLEVLSFVICRLSSDL